MAKHVLMTGGTGLIGRRLTSLLLAKGYKVSHVARHTGDNDSVKTYLWNIRKGVVDERCIENVDTIIHLAGAPIAQGRWTDERKKEIVESRTKSISLLYEVMRKKPHKISTIISASATGYYSDRGDDLMTEDCEPADDFLGQCCVAWERAVDAGTSLGCRVVKFRTGIVLARNEGALKQMVLPVKMGVGSPLGEGNQWVPWIHIADAVQHYVFALENDHLEGTYNMTAPRPVTNALLMHSLARQLQKSWWAPKVPAAVLRLAMGEMADMVLGSTKVSSAKIRKVGFSFRYPSIESALAALYPRE